MKRLRATVKLKSDETLDDVRDQIRDKVDDLDLQFKHESYSDDGDLSLVDDDNSYDSHDDNITFMDDDDSYDS